MLHVGMYEYGAYITMSFMAGSGLNSILAGQIAVIAHNFFEIQHIFSIICATEIYRTRALSFLLNSSILIANKISDEPVLYRAEQARK